MPERFTETLRAASEADWSHAVQHRFVNEWFADSPLEGTGFELPVPREKERAFSSEKGDGAGG
jgi:hypothetical protein